MIDKYTYNKSRNIHTKPTIGMVHMEEGDESKTSRGVKAIRANPQPIYKM